MKSTREFPLCTITKKAVRAAKSGHPWVYADEILSAEGTLQNGCMTDVVGENGAYLGTGFWSEASKIRVRLVSKNANDRFDEAFWQRRIQYAWNYRKAVLRPEDLSCCRVIFGEADGFPGLTVDRFGDILVTQTLSVGIETRKELLFPLLADVLRADGQRITGIYERNDAGIRTLEGLNQNKGWFLLPGEPSLGSAVTEITENGIVYEVDFENGQKTGFFLDQKYNRLAAAKLARGRTVLDCFTHTGSFALNAAHGGAKHVTAVDISQSAVNMAQKNAALNGLSDRMDFVAADVFELLPRLSEQGGHPYDFIILDPPAFTKNRKTVDAAKRGYKEINLRAMRLLPRGGYLATCSCSHFMPDALFTEMLKSAALDADVQLRQIEARQQSPDHPILWNVPETSYLKFYVFQVV